MATENLGMIEMTDADMVGTADLMENFNIIDAFAGLFKDKVIESGTSGIWDMLKLENGLMVCAGKSTSFSATFTGSPIATAYSDNIAAFPAGFIAKPKVWLSLHSDQAYNWIGGWESQTTSAKVAASFLSNTAGTRSLSVTILAIGRWK